VIYGFLKTKHVLISQEAIYVEDKKMISIFHHPLILKAAAASIT